MVEKDFQIQQELDEKTSSPMRFDNVLFLQVNRINEAMTRMDGNFMAGIEALEMNLAYFVDKNFKKDMKELDSAANRWLAQQRQIGGYVPTDAKEAAAYARAKELMKAVLRLIGRAGFYPESQATYKAKM